MGLAGPRKRQKISHDPNNTSWARDTTGFGHKILTQQGWKPGDFLGAEGAAHASHFTAASASHVRVALKDDTLGIGARRTGETAENFGLGGLADIYGRLSGKETAKEQKERQKARADMGRLLYIERRYGPSNFVSGGLLVGDKLKSLEEEEEEEQQPVAAKGAESDKLLVGEKREKKKKDKKRRRQDAEAANESPDGIEAAEVQVCETAEAIGGDDAKAARKAEKRKRKQERRERKEAKRAARAASTAAAADDDDTAQHDEEASGGSGGSADEAKAMQVVAPAATFGGSRQAVRRRFIQSKRMAAMDPRALKEILMAR